MFGEAPRNTTDSSLPCGLLWNVEGNNDGNAPEICRANNLQILHIFLVIEEKVTNPRGMMDTVAGGHECLLVFVHESCSSLKHDDNLKIGLVDMPAGSSFRCILRSHKVRDNLAFGCLCDPQISVLEEIAQSTTLIGGVVWMNVREKRISLHAKVSVSMGE